SLTRILEVLADAEIRLRDAASKKILIEITLLKAIEARSAVSLDAVLKQLNALRGGSGAGVAAATAPTNTGAKLSSHKIAESGSPAAKILPSHPVEHAAPPTLAGSAGPAETSDGTGDLESLWARLVETAGRASPFVRTYLVEAHPVSFEKSVFTIGFDPEFADHLGLVDNARNHALLQTKLAELGHPAVQFRFVKAEAPVGRVVRT